MSASASDSPGPLTIHINGEARSLEGPCSVIALLEVLDLGSKKVAVAINHKVVARSRHAEVALADGDQIEILEAVGGG
jgi:sulfur carrier protein